MADEEAGLDARLGTKKLKTDVDRAIAQYRRVEEAMDRLAKKTPSARLGGAGGGGGSRPGGGGSGGSGGKKSLLSGLGMAASAQSGGISSLIGMIGKIHPAAAIATVAIGGVALAVRKLSQEISAGVVIITELEDNLLGTQAVTNATEAEMSKLSAQTRELGRSTRYRATEVAAEQQILARAGFSVAQSLRAVPEFLKFASAGQLELAEATTIGADVMKSFEIEASGLERVLDVLALASSRANTDVRGLGQGATFAAPVFNALKLPIEEMSAGLAVLADRGMKGEMAGTGLRISMKSLISPTKQAEKVLASMGIALTDVDFQAIGDDGETLQDVLELLAEKGLNATQAFQIFSARGGNAMLGLTSGVEQFGEITEELFTRADGTIGRMSDTMESGLGGSMRRLESATEGSRIALAEGYTPALIRSQEKAIELRNVNERLFTGLGKLSGALRDATVNAGLYFAAFITGTSLVVGLSDDLENLTKSSVGIGKEWEKTAGAIAGGTKSIADRQILLGGALSDVTSRIEDEKESFERLGKAQKHSEAATKRHTALMGKLGGQRAIFRQQLEQLTDAVGDATEADREAAEVAEAHAAAVEREAQQAESAAAYTRNLEEARREATKITEGLKTSEELIGDEIERVNEIFRLGALDVETYEKEIERLNGSLEDLEKIDLQNQIDNYKNLLAYETPDIQSRVIIDDEELVGLLNFLDEEEFYVRIDTATLEAEARDAVARGLTNLSFDEYLKGLQQRHGPRELPPPAWIPPMPEGQNEKEAAVEAMIGRSERVEETWYNITDAIYAASDAVGEMDSGLGALLGLAGGLSDGFGQRQTGKADLAAARNPAEIKAAQAQMEAGGAAMADAFMGAVGGWIGQAAAGGGETSFGGTASGTMASTGQAIGSMFGGTGAFVGAAIGAMVKTEGDMAIISFNETLEGIESFIQADEALRGIGTQIGDAFADFFQTIMDETGIEVLEGLGGLKLTIEDEYFRIETADGREMVTGGIESLSDGMAWAAEQVLGMNKDAGDMGDSMRGMFDSFGGGTAAAGDFEDLLAAFDLAKMADDLKAGLDITTSAIDGFFDEIDETLASNLDLAHRYNLVYADVITITDEAIRLKKEEIGLSRDSLFGATAAGTAYAAMAVEMQGFNRNVEEEAEERTALATARTLYADSVHAEADAVLGLGDAVSGGLGGVGDGVTEFVDGLGEAEGEIAGAGDEFAEALGEEVLGIFRDARDGRGGGLRDAGFGAGFGDSGGVARGEDLDEIKEAGLEGVRDTAQRIDLLREAREEANALTESLSEIPDAFTAEEIADVFRKGASEAGQSLVGLMRQVEGEQYGIAQMQKFAAIDYQLQLAAQIRATQLYMETADEASRALLGPLLQDAEGLLADFTSGKVKLGGGGSGAGKQRREEEKRAAEEAERALGDFNTELLRLELNSQRGGSALGDLTVRLAEMTAGAEEALAFGATAADVRRQQQLALRGEMQDVTQPWGDARQDNFLDLSGDVEQDRRSAIAEATAIAVAQSELLSIPFDVAFREAERLINSGAKNIQAALVRDVINVFNLPLEGIRKQNRDIKSQMKNLKLAHDAGAISQAKYLSLIGQIQDAHAQSLGGEVLGMLDTYYSEVEGAEEFKHQLVMMNFELELAMAQLRFDALVMEGALAEDVVNQIGGFLDYMSENPPNWDEYFADSPSGGGNYAGGGGSYAGGTGTPLASSADYDALIASINSFLTGFDTTAVGQFEAQAIQWTDALTNFGDEIDEAMNSIVGENGVYTGAESLDVYAAQMYGVGTFAELTAEQMEELQTTFQGLGDASGGIYNTMADLIDLYRQAAELGEVDEQAAGKLLDMYRGTVTETNAMAAEYAGINAQFLDITTALEMMGATAAEVAESGELYQQRALAFWEKAYSGVRSLEDELRGGTFGGVSTLGARDQAQSKFDELKARLAADPMDFDALSQLDAAGRALIAAEQAYSGGTGAEYSYFTADILALLATLQAPADIEIPVAPPIDPSPEITDRMDTQTDVLIATQVEQVEIRKLLEQIWDGGGVAYEQRGELHEEALAVMTDLASSPPIFASA